MNWKRVIFGAGIGFALGFLVAIKWQANTMAPEKILKRAKEHVNEKFPITGSWIHMIPETYTKNDIDYVVYRGGITAANESGEDVPYEFIADAKTGTILEFWKMNGG